MIFESRGPVEWLNYHHLLYFYTVAREGSVTKASDVLRLAQPTLSGQIRKLEEAFEEKLFVREGRNLARMRAVVRRKVPGHRRRQRAVSDRFDRTVRFWPRDLRICQKQAGRS